MQNQGDNRGRGQGYREDNAWYTESLDQIRRSSQKDVHEAWRNQPGQRQSVPIGRQANPANRVNTGPKRGQSGAIGRQYNTGQIGRQRPANQPNYSHNHQPTHHNPNRQPIQHAPNHQPINTPNHKPINRPTQHSPINTPNQIVCDDRQDRKANKVKQTKQGKQGEKSKAKQVKQTNTNKKGLDYILWSIMTILFGVLVFLVFKSNMLSTKYILTGIAGSLVVCLGYIVSIARRKNPSWRRVCVRTSMGFLSGALMFGNYTFYNGLNVLENMTNSDTVMKVSLMTMQGADLAPKDIDELAGQSVGYTTANDKNATCYAMSKITEAQAGVKFVPYKDYVSLYDALKNGEVVSAIIPNVRESTLKTEIKGYENTVDCMKTFVRTQNAKDRKKTKVVEEVTNEPFVVYLAGLGDDGDPSEDDLTDVNILAFVDPAKHELTTVSVPRDSFVPNPQLNMGSDKLTHLGMSGVYNSMKGLEETFGIAIDYYARVSFSSIIELVDAIGGVTVDVEIPFTEQDEKRSFAYNDLIHLEAGKQKLNGKQALAYSRHRKGYEDGTAGRERAQTKIIKAMISQMCSANGIANINQVMKVAEKYVSTDIPMSLIQSIVKEETESMAKWNVYSLTLEDIPCASLTTVSMPSLQLSCQTLPKKTIDATYTLYKTLKGENEGVTVKDFIKSFNEHVKKNQQNIEQGIAEDTAFYEKCLKAPENTYVITTEESAYINFNAPVYGLDNTMVDVDVDTVSTKMIFNLPKVSSGYYE